jgi:glycyl-tRNA synthetase alpha subunit
MKDHLYFQQLSGVYTLDEDETRQNQTVIDGILSKLEKKCSEYNKEVQTTATYYKTDKKTKEKLFIIYMGLILALSFSYYYGNEILMNHPDIQKVMNR